MLGSTIMMETNMAESDFYPPAARRDSLSDPFSEPSIHLRLSDTSEVTTLSWGTSSVSSMAGPPSMKQSQSSWLCSKCSYTNTDSFRSTCAICGGPNGILQMAPPPVPVHQRQQRHSPTTTDSNYMSFSGLSMLTQADSDGSSPDLLLQRRSSDATMHSKSTARTGVSTLLISNCVHKEKAQPQPAVRAASPVSQDGSDCTQRTTNSTGINSVVTITNRGRKAIPHDDPEEKPSHRIFRPVRNVASTAASMTVAGDSAEVSSTILIRQRPERRNSSRSLGAPSRQKVSSHRSVLQSHRRQPDEGMTPCTVNPPTRTNSRRRPNNNMVAPCPPEFSPVRRPRRKPKKDDDEWSCSVGLDDATVDMFQPRVKI